MGAVAEDGTGVLDPQSAGMLGMTQAMLDATLARESGSCAAGWSATATAEPRFPSADGR